MRIRPILMKTDGMNTTRSTCLSRRRSHGSSLHWPIQYRSLDNGKDVRNRMNSDALPSFRIISRVLWILKRITDHVLDIIIIFPFFSSEKVAYMFVCCCPVTFEYMIRYDPCTLDLPKCNDGETNPIDWFLHPNPSSPHPNALHPCGPDLLPVDLSCLVLYCRRWPQGLNIIVARPLSALRVVSSFAVQSCCLKTVVQSL